MPKLDVRDAALNYSTVGDGPPLVLVHSSGTDLTTWDNVVDELARDQQVIAYDRRGYGKSLHRPVRDHRIHARDFIAVLKQVADRPPLSAGAPATILPPRFSVPNCSRHW